VTDRLKKQDIDGDGLVDNGGFADQTYDAWTVVGARYLNDIISCGIFGFFAVHIVEVYISHHFGLVWKWLEL
jgi:uncharacterized protein (DUF608 family)